MRDAVSERITVRLADSFGRTLTWMRPQFFGRITKLVSDGDTLAMLRWHGLRSADAFTATGEWTIRRTGLLSSSAEMMDVATRRTVLTLRTRFRKGTFETPDGVAYSWRRTGWFRLEIAVFNAQGTELLRCAGGLGFRGRGKLTLQGSATNEPLLDQLVLASWYVIQQLHRRRHN
jgi:hypothetical protein